MDQNMLKPRNDLKFFYKKMLASLALFQFSPKSVHEKL